MAQTAAPLMDHVIPHVPVRQWVLSLPIPLRLLLAAQPKLVTPVSQVVLKFKTPWRDGPTHLVMSQLEFVQRLTALVSRPKLCLIRFDDMLAPLSAQVEPQEPKPPTHATVTVEWETVCAQHWPVRLSWAKPLKQVFDLDLEHCPNCGAGPKIIAAILEKPLIEKIRTYLGLHARAPPLTAARGQTLQAA